jgi:branched-chain amino acid aminotransferase
MLDPQGFVAECTGANLFVVKKDRIYTPQRSTILEGITRDSLTTIANDLGYEVTETEISRDALYTADELFVCGTAAEVVALREVDFRQVGSGAMGPICRKIQHTYHEAVRGRDPRYQHWLTPVPHVELVAATG